jgi:tetratricopeptide (TPR) repeat protein
MATDSAAPTSTTALGPDPTRNVWQVPTFLLGVTVFVGAWQGWLPLGTPDPAADFSRDLAALRTSYDKVSPDRDELKELLGRVAANVDAFPEFTAVGRFSLGCGYVRLAELTAAPDEARTYWLLARQHFEGTSAEQLRDPGDGPRLAFRSAKARVAVGLPATASTGDIKLHMSLLANSPANEDPGEAPRLQGELALRLSPPEVVTAREAFTRYLTTAGIATPPASLARVRLQLADLHLRAKEHDLARKWLEQIGADAPPDVLAPAKSALAKVRMAEEDWLGAAREWEAVRAAPGVSHDLRIAAAYQLGLCRLNSREPALAAKMFEEAAKGEGHEARAAAARLAELHLKGSESDKRLLVPELLANAIKGIAGRKDYNNPLLSLNEIQSVFDLAVSVLIGDGVYESALKVVDSYMVVSAGRARERRAETLAAWADALHKQNRDYKPKAAAAAAEYEALAGLQPAVTAKADTLRRAAGMYRLAGETQPAVGALKSAVQLNGLPEQTMGTVWSELAEALLAAGRPIDEVVRAFNEAMASGTPVSTVVRYRLGRQFLDAQNPGLAALGRSLFEQIAKQEMVARSEQEHHELAIVGLGYEVMRTNNYSEAEVWFRKQLALYPTGSEASMGRLFLGICLIQRTATAPQIDSGTITRTREEAIQLFKQVVADSDAKFKKDGKLPDRDAWLRLQAALRILQTYQQMQKPNDLLAEASSLLDRHRGTVDELIILSLVYHAFKQKNETGRALQTRDQMKELFDRLPPRAFPAEKGEYSRAYWEKVWFASDAK